jgi:EAL domain-containing protein (putative c-di-GMP-specific phosphodiesterase class I)
MSTEMNIRVKQYIQLRDRIKQIDEAHDTERKKYSILMEEVGGLIQAFLDANKLENLKTEHGTAYVTKRYTASLADPDAFMSYVIANKAFELLDRRANATACREFTEEHKALPPGVNLSAIQTVGVRRPSGK